MLIWKGAGIAVPIIVFICGWISSFWFEDTRLGNLPFIGLAFLIACIPVGLIGLGLSGSKDENGNKVGGGHSFFFIPVAWWGLILAGAGVYFYWF